jgi:hypothetical protein
MIGADGGTDGGTDGGADLGADAGTDGREVGAGRKVKITDGYVLLVAFRPG